MGVASARAAEGGRDGSGGGSASTLHSRQTSDVSRQIEQSATTPSLIANKLESTSSDVWFIWRSSASAASRCAVWSGTGTVTCIVAGAALGRSRASTPSAAALREAETTVEPAAVAAVVMAVLAAAAATAVVAAATAVVAAAPGSGGGDGCGEGGGEHGGGQNGGPTVHRSLDTTRPVLHTHPSSQSPARGGAVAAAAQDGRRRVRPCCNVRFQRRGRATPNDRSLSFPVDESHTEKR